MKRVVKVSIGTNHTCADELEPILRKFWAHLTPTIHVQEDHTFVVFITDDASLQLLENVTASIANIDNVNSVELTPTEVLNAIRDVKELQYLTDARHEYGLLTV